MHTTPPSLLEQVRRPDDQQAWRRFVDLYTPLLFSSARRVGLTELDAADLVQDVFTLLVRKLPEFQYDRNKGFRAWPAHRRPQPLARDAAARLAADSSCR